VKSSFSNGNGGNNCVDVTAAGKGAVIVRDTKQDVLAKQPILVFGLDEWWAFIDGVKAGEFDGIAPRG
jgi:hypothetical protein